MNVRSLLVIIFLAAGLLPAGADDIKPNGPKTPAAEATVPDNNAIGAKEQRTLESFGAQNKACLEWSDGCAVCIRQQGDRFACSLPGIACEPAALACRREDKSGPQLKPSGK